MKLTYPPKLSIVTPSLNQGHFLEECIDSILSQHYPNLEYIIMDGGSSDNSMEIIRRHEKHLAHWQSAADGGQYHAIDVGLKRSSGQIMTWLNADDKLQPGALQTVAEIFFERPEVDWLTGRPNSLDESGAPNWQCDHLPLNSRQRFLDNDIFIQQEGTFWSRDLWNKGGGTLRTDLTYAGDYELWGRFFRYAQLFAVDMLLAAFRDHPAQKSKARDKYSWEARTALDRELLIHKESSKRPLPAPLPIIIGDRGTAMTHTTTPQPVAADELYRGILSLANAGWNDLATAALERLIAEQPDHALAHNDLGVLYYGMGDMERSLGHYRQAVRLEPSAPTFTKNLADMYFAVQGQVEEALQLYLQVLQADPNDLEALFAIGHISRSQGQAEDARTFFMRVLELDPTHQAARCVVTEIDSGNAAPPVSSVTAPKTEAPRKAIAELEQLLAHSPENALAHNDLGVLYFQAGEQDLAQAHYQEAVRLMPENRTFMKNLADFYYLVAKRYEEAVNLYVKVIEADPDDLEALLALGTIATEAGQNGPARTYFRKALCVEPLNPTARQQIDIIEGFPDLPLPPDDGTPLVSAIVSTYNAARFLPGCLDDLEGQTIADRIEVIVVDSGSTQNERAIVEEYRKRYDNIVYIRTEERETVYGAWNRGIKASRGRYITNANADDRHAPDALERLARVLAGRPEVALVYADVIITETENEFFGRHTRIGNYNWLDWDRDALLNKGCFIGPQPMWRRSLHDEYGYFDPSLITSGDYEFWLRISQAHPCYHLGMPLGLYLKSPDSIEHRNADLQEEENRRILTEYREAAVQGKIIKSADTKPIDATAGPATASASLLRADRLVEEGRDDEAVTLLREAGIRSPAERPRYCRRIAVILINGKRFAEALATLGELSADADVATLKGYCFEGLERNGEARELVEKVLAQAPHHAPALNLKGVLTYKEGYREFAEVLFRQAMEGNPTYGEPATNLGVLLWAAGKRAEGLDWLEKGLELDSISADHATHFHAAVCGIGELARGERAFRRAWQRYPHNRRAGNLLVDLLLRQERYAEALTEARTLVARFGADDELLDAALAIKTMTSATASATKAETSLSLCIIARNEAATLPRCLNSVVDLADEIIVVDTGSTDRTMDIATLFGARVDHFVWQDDFSTARNFALEKATGKWILVLDADEVIAARDAAAIRTLVKESKEPVAYAMLTRNYVTEVNTEGWTANDGEYPDEEAAAGWVPSTKVRLFPNDSRIRFEKPVHEMVEYALERAKIPVKRCPVPVHHYGKLDKERETAKGLAYLQLGQSKVANNDGDAQGIYELGVQAANLGKYPEAIELLQRVLQIVPDEPMALFNLSSAQFRLGKYRDAMKNAERALGLNHDLKEAACTYAMCQLYIGDIKKAIETMEQVLKHAKDYPPAMATLAAAYYCDGDRKKAATLIESLGKMNYNGADFLQDHAERLMECQRPELARRISENIAEANTTAGDMTRNKRTAART